jgi:large subunit ribosomal protein L15
MNLDEVLRKAGPYKARTRLGRGIGSGHGKTSGRGTKGMRARAGSHFRLAYEGGQNPVLARIPKRGFTNALFRKEFQVVNVGSLERFDSGSRVDAAMLEAARLIQDAAKPVKVLGKGELSKKLTVVAAGFSASARDKIAKAGGAAEHG